MRWIIVPESLAADDAGQPLPRPSFAFRQVLDRSTEMIGARSQVYLAPANNFGGAMPEEQTAFYHLQSKSPNFQVFCQGINLPPVTDRPAYVDTWGNATLLRQAIDPKAGPYVLVAAAVHARRATWCFVHAGYNLTQTRAISFSVLPERVMLRNFYYRHPFIHRVYETLALARDVIKYSRLT